LFFLLNSYFLQMPTRISLTAALLLPIIILIFEAWWFDSSGFFVCVSQARAWMPRRGSEDLPATSTSMDHQPVNSWVSKFACFPTFDNLKFFIYKLYNTVMLKLRCQLPTFDNLKFLFTNCAILWCWSWGSHQSINQGSFDHLLSAQLFFSPRKKDCRWVLMNKTSS
jgi:hypothetical protein